MVKAIFVYVTSVKGGEKTKKKLRNSTKAKTTSLMVLLLSVFLLSALAGVQFVGKVFAAGYTEYAGILGGADFVARFPEPWNGMLVVFCRFYWPFKITAATALQYQNDTVSELLNQGFAVAASSYGSTGLCIQAGLNRTYELTMHIINTYHITGKVFLWGISMGGAVALLLGEKYPKIYSGVLDTCGIKDLKDMYARAASKTNYEVETGGTPTTQPKAYEDRSPTYHANITIPVITIHGTNDTTVPFNQSIMYQTAVANAGRSNLYRLYNMTGEEHVSSAITEQQPTRFAELVEWSDTLTGAITLEPAAQAPGASVAVHGANFGIQKPVGVGFGAEVNVINETLPHSTGPYDVAGGPYITHVAHVPMKPGSYRKAINITGTLFYVIDTDQGNGTFIAPASAGFVNGTVDYVTGKVTLNLNTSLSSSTYYVELANYTYYQYNVTPAAGVSTNALGNFLAYIVVPSVANGVYAVTAVDTQGHIATLRYATIPEGLTVGVMVLLSTAAVIVSIRYFRKRPRWESCSLGKTVETRET